MGQLGQSSAHLGRPNTSLSQHQLVNQHPLLQLAATDTCWRRAWITALASCAVLKLCIGRSTAVIKFLQLPLIAYVHVCMRYISVPV